MSRITGLVIMRGQGVAEVGGREGLDLCLAPTGKFLPLYLCRPFARLVLSHEKSGTNILNLDRLVCFVVC